MISSVALELLQQLKTGQLGRQIVSHSQAGGKVSVIKPGLWTRIKEGTWIADKRRKKDTKKWNSTNKSNIYCHFYPAPGKGKVFFSFRPNKFNVYLAAHIYIKIPGLSNTPFI